MLLVVGIFIFLISGYYPHITEKVYSSLIYKILGQTISSFTGILSFSLAEVIIVFSAFFMAGYLIKTVADVIKGPKRKKVLKRFTVNLMAIAGIIYFSFQILWGINYNRIELTEMLGLKTEAPTQEELVGLCEDLIARANQLREGLKEDHRGVMELPYGKVEALKIAHKGFERASSYYPHLDGKYGKPKGLVLSKPMSYTGITGFFFPFTAEANINMAIPEPLFAFTVTHEMAHQRGFAREEEANFIAYITCIHHPDQYFRYAGTLSALIYSMNALGKSDEGKYRELLDTFSEGVTRDWKFNSEYWHRHSGPVEQASDKINDTYLKTQNQRAGVESYGAMVDLLIAEYRGRTGA